MSPKKPDKAKEERFDQLMDQLGVIVERLEQADLSLEDSLLQFENGIELSRRGQTILDKAEARVEKLLADGSLDPLALDGEGKAQDDQDAGDHR